VPRQVPVALQSLHCRWTHARQAPTVQCATAHAFRLAGPFGSGIVSMISCDGTRSAGPSLLFYSNSPAQPCRAACLYRHLQNPALFRITAIASKRLYRLRQNLLELLGKAIVLTGEINFFEGHPVQTFSGFKGFDFLARFTAEWQPQKNWNHIKEGQNEARGCAGQRVSMP
jgi:hypothetical protein